MANNNILKNAAYSGALSGLTSRWVELVSASSASGQQAILGALAFATMVDSLIPAGNYSATAAQLLSSLCQGVWNNRMPLSDIPSTYDDVAQTLVNIFTGAQGGLEPVVTVPTTLSDMVAVTFAGHDNGSVSGNYSLNWANGQKQILTLNGAVNLTMSAPAGQMANYCLKVINLAAHNITWGGNTKSAADSPLTSGASAETIISIFWDGTTFFLSTYAELATPATTQLVP